MTESERLERERDWVRARFNCTVDSVFKELVAVIESDISSFNKLSGQDDCEINHLEDRKVTFRRGKRVSSLSTDGRTIHVGYMFGNSRLSDLTIKPKWNEAQMRCDLLVEGETISTHRASQKVIGPVLFP